MSATCRSKVLVTAAMAATAVALSAVLSAPAFAAAPGTAGLAVAVAAPAAAARAPVLAFTPSPHDYGQVTRGQTASQTFTLTNSGRSASGRLSLALSGPVAFTLNRDGCRTKSLVPRQSCTVTVRFTPASPGKETAALTAASHKIVLATDALTGTGTNTSQLYWTNNTAGTITEANLDGSNPQTIVTGQNGPEFMAVNSSRIYWANLGTGTVMAANLDGTGVTTLAPGPALPTGVAVDSSHIYWTDQADDTVHDANLDGSNPQIVASSQNDPVGVAIGPQCSPRRYRPAGLSPQPGHAQLHGQKREHSESGATEQPEPV